MRELSMQTILDNIPVLMAFYSGISARIEIDLLFHRPGKRTFVVWRREDYQTYEAQLRLMGGIHKY